MLTTKIKNLFKFLLGKHSARNATIITTGLSLFSKVFGYGRTLLVAYLFGATAFVDAYYVALGAVSFIPSTLNATIETAILPNMIQNDEKTARNLFGYFFRFFSIIALIISILLLMFPESYIRIFARTFDTTRIAYASSMIKWLLPFAIATLAIGLLSAWANYRNRFAVASTVMAFTNILVIPTLLILYPLIGDTALPAFQGFGYVLLAIVMWYILRGVPLRPKGKLQPKLIRKVLNDFTLRILASGAIFIYALVDRYFASSLPPGNVSAISYATLLFSQPTGLTATAFSIYFVRANEKATSPTDSDHLLFTTLFMAASYFLPASALLSILARPIIVLLLGYGAFDANAIELTYPCLAILALGLPIFIWNVIINKHAIALGKLKLIVAWGYIGVVGNFVLDWLLVKKYGAPGLCAATTAMWYVSTICLMLFFCRDILLQALRAVLLQVILVISWATLLFHILQGMNIIINLITGVIVGILHILLCEKFGLYQKMPINWRPNTIFILLIRKAFKF